MLVDSNWRGRPRKLLLQANRNGFYYVLDRPEISDAVVAILVIGGYLLVTP